LRKTNAAPYILWLHARRPHDIVLQIFISQQGETIVYLKALEMVGFKSFADNTKLEFLPGMTAIVGPNGCGKSNIGDALRWVLGEQSAKAMRATKM